MHYCVQLLTKELPSEEDIRRIMQPYNYDVVTKLIKTAKDNNIDFAVDVYPFYGSDVDVTLDAGYDIRHGLIGSGVYASHGYERSHRDGIENTFRLLINYCD